jgi:hypothetical protein
MRQNHLDLDRSSTAQAVVESQCQFLFFRDLNTALLPIFFEVLNFLRDPGWGDVREKNRQRHQAGFALPTLFDDESLTIIGDAIEYLAGAGAELRHGEQREVERH